MLYAGNNLDKARAIFAAGIKRRPRVQLTIRQRSRVPNAVLTTVARRGT